EPSATRRRCAPDGRGARDRCRLAGFRPAGAHGRDPGGSDRGRDRGRGAAGVPDPAGGAAGRPVGHRVSSPEHGRGGPRRMSTYIDLSDRAIDALAKGPIKALVEAVSIDLRDEIVRTMDPGPPRTGREYPVPGTGIIDPATGRRKRGTGRTYRASAPGQPPAVRLGSYRDSWQTIPAVVDGDQVV